MKKLLTDPLQQRLYTPLSREESLIYEGCYFQRNKTAFDKSVIEITSIAEDGTVTFVEKSMQTVKIRPPDENGYTIPYKCIIATNENISIPKKGRLVYAKRSLNKNEIKL